MVKVDFPTCLQVAMTTHYVNKPPFLYCQCQSLPTVFRKKRFKAMSSTNERGVHPLQPTSRHNLPEAISPQKVGNITIN